MVKPAIPAAARIPPEMINIFFSFMWRTGPRSSLHHTWNGRSRFPPKYTGCCFFDSAFTRVSRLGDDREVPRSTAFMVTLARHWPQDKGRINIRRLNSPLPKFKLDEPYGEYRATYAKGIFRPFTVLFVVTNTHDPRASDPGPDAAGRHQWVPQRIPGYPGPAKTATER